MRLPPQNPSSPAPASSQARTPVIRSWRWSILTGWSFLFPFLISPHKRPTFLCLPLIVRRHSVFYNVLWFLTVDNKSSTQKKKKRASQGADVFAAKTIHSSLNIYVKSYIFGRLRYEIFKGHIYELVITFILITMSHAELDASPGTTPTQMTSFPLGFPVCIATAA